MAVRIVGVDLPQNKRGEISLTYIYGIGRSAALTILEKAGVDGAIKVQDWTDEQAAKVREVIFHSLLYQRCGKHGVGAVQSAGRGCITWLCQAYLRRCKVDL